MPMLQVQEKAPQAAEEASRNITKGASEVCCSLALLSKVALLLLEQKAPLCRPLCRPGRVAGQACYRHAACLT